MTFTAVGSFGSASAGGALASFSLTTGGAGNFVLVEVIGWGGRTPTALSSSNATWVTLGTVANCTVNTNFNASGGTKAQVFLGTVTSASTQTVTITWSGAGSNFEGAQWQEYSSTTGVPVLDSQVTFDNTGTNTWSSLGPPATAPGIYFGYALNNTAAIAGSSSGFIYNLDPGNNGAAYNLNVTSSVAAVWSASDPGEGFGKIVLVAPGPAGGGGPFVPWQYRPHAAPGEPFVPWPWPLSAAPPAAAAPAPAPQVFPPHRAYQAPGRARLGRAATVAAGILAATTLSPQPSSVPPSRPQPPIGHPAPHRVLWRGNAEPPALPFLTAKLPPTAVSPRPPHRAITRRILAVTTLSPQPSSVPGPQWRQPAAPRPAHRAIWRVTAAPPPPVVTVTAVPPERPQPVINRPPPPHRAVGKGILAVTSLSPQPSRVPPPQWRQPNAPRPAHRAIWRAVAGPAPAVVVVTGVPPARPQPVTNRPPAPHRAVARWVLAKTTLSAQPAAVPPARPQPVTNRPPAPHRAIWRTVAGLPPVAVQAVPSRPRPVTNRPPAPHRALVRILAAKTTLSAQPSRVPGPQWRQPFAPRPAHRATWRAVRGPAPPPPPFTIGALTALSAAQSAATVLTGANALTAATAALGTQSPGDKASGFVAGSTAPLGGITATDV